MTVPNKEEWVQWVCEINLDEELLVLLDEYLSKPKQYEFIPEPKEGVQTNGNR